MNMCVVGDGLWCVYNSLFNRKNLWKESFHRVHLFLYPPKGIVKSTIQYSAVAAAAAAAKLLQLCPTLCDPIDGSPSKSPVPGILQARVPEWVVLSFSNAWKWKVKMKLLSHVWLFSTPWTVAHQLLSLWNFPGKNPGVGCHSLLQGTFLTRGSNLSLLHLR